MLKGVPAATLERLARVARMSKPSAIAALREPRRTATVAALFHTLEATAQDDAAELAEGLLIDLVRDAEASAKKARLRSLRDLDDAAMLLREMGRLVMADDALPLDHWRDALFERGPTGRAGDRHGRGRRHRAARRGQTLRPAPRSLAPRAAAVLQHRHPHRHGRGPGRAGGQGRRLPSQGHPGLVGRQAAGRADRGPSQGVAPACYRPRRKSRRSPRLRLRRDRRLASRHQAPRRVRQARHPVRGSTPGHARGPSLAGVAADGLARARPVARQLFDTAPSGSKPCPSASTMHTARSRGAPATIPTCASRP